MRPKAAIDIGTNSFHLVVANIDKYGVFETLTKEKEMVRLGESAGDIRYLSDAAIQRGVDALKRFKAIADSFEAPVDAVATSAVREAKNGNEFVERAEKEAGVSVEVISGVEEARLIHLGVIQALPIFESQVLVVDIGGGSTEMVIGKGGKVLGARSVKLGHLRLTNRFFPDGEITEGSVKECRDFVASYLVPTLKSLKPHGFEIAVGSSGTSTTIGDVIRIRTNGEALGAGLDTVISASELAKTVELLTSYKTADERESAISGLGERRSDVIVGGAILLEEIFKGFEIKEMVTSPYALREGVLLDRSASLKKGRKRLRDLRTDSLHRFAAAFDQDGPHVRHSTDLALMLFDKLHDVHDLTSHDREMLEAAAILHNVGLFVSHAAHHRHSYYVIRNSDRLTGYSEREIEIIAQVARYHRRSHPKSSHLPFEALEERDKTRVRWLAGILRLGIALDRTQSELVKKVKTSIEDGVLKIKVKTEKDVDASVEIFMANSRSSLLEEVSGLKVEVV